MHQDLYMSGVTSGFAGATEFFAPFSPFKLSKSKTDGNIHVQTNLLDDVSGNLR